MISMGLGINQEFGLSIFGLSGIHCNTKPRRENTEALLPTRAPFPNVCRNLTIDKPQSEKILDKEGLSIRPGQQSGGTVRFSFGSQFYAQQTLCVLRSTCTENKKQCRTHRGCDFPSPPKIGPQSVQNDRHRPK